MRAGLLLESIKIQKPTVAVDGYGANDVKWNDYIEARANVTYQSGNRVNDNNKNLAILKDYDGNKEERKEQNNENK